MLEHVIDNKTTIRINDSSIKDLTPSIFDKNKTSISVMYNVYRVPESMKMRIDLISLAAYGTDKYADVVMKYNGISNPFSINTDDILYMPTLDTIENDLMVPEVKSEAAANIRNYHKYVDKNKAPKTVGSEINNKIVGKNVEFREANISPEGSSSIVLRNGRIYFETRYGRRRVSRIQKISVVEQIKRSASICAGGYVF